MTYSEALDQLTIVLPTLSPRDQSFAGSLLTQANKGGLSDKQWYWVRKLATAAKAPAAPATPAATLDFSAMIAIFDAAREHLKFPKVRLQLDDGRPVVMSVAGANARQPGSINLTDGRPFGSSTFYGRVSIDGSLQISPKVEAATATALTALLTAFAADPAAVAAAYGKLVGSCCFCAKALTDKRSITVGYGPICAGHYGLPWGE